MPKQQKQEMRTRRVAVRQRKGFDWRGQPLKPGQPYDADILIHNHLAPAPWRTGAIFYATPYVLIFKKVQILEGQHPKNTGFQFFVWVVFSGQRPFEIQRANNSEIKRFCIFWPKNAAFFTATDPYFWAGKC